MAGGCWACDASADANINIIQRREIEPFRI
jgi:hypothetical protein